MNFSQTLRFPFPVAFHSETFHLFTNNYTLSFAFPNATIFLFLSLLPFQIEIAQNVLQTSTSKAFRWCGEMLFFSEYYITIYYKILTTIICWSCASYVLPTSLHTKMPSHTEFMDTFRATRSPQWLDFWRQVGPGCWDPTGTFPSPCAFQSNF